MKDLKAIDLVELPVAGMHSAACVARIRGMLAGTPGLVTLEVEQGKVEIGFSPHALSIENVCRQIEALGYSIPFPWEGDMPFQRLLKRLAESSENVTSRRMDWLPVREIWDGVSEHGHPGPR